jgi:type IX secretion system PorP/SprF family membrane protein
MKFRIINFSIILFTMHTANGQQQFRLSQYMQHNYLFNPAAAGIADNPSVGLTYKKMWSGMDGGPQTTVLYGDSYFSKYKVGAAGVLYHDVTGPTSRSGGEIALSYAVPISDKRKIQFGLSGVLFQERLNKAAIEKYIPGDPILAGPGSWISGDAAAGVYYASPTINIGFSVKQLIQSKLDLIKTPTSIEGRLYRHYYLMGSYNWRTDENNVIIPNFLVKFFENAPVDIEAGARLEHKDLIWIGFNFHYQQDFSAFAGLKINHKYMIGYAYDQYLTPLSIFNPGGNAHEISLRYAFGK